MHHALWAYNYFDIEKKQDIPIGALHYNLGRENSWVSTVEPIIDKEKTYIFEGDSPITAQFVYNGLNHVRSGLNFTDSPKTAAYLVVKYDKEKNNLRFFKKTLGIWEQELKPIVLN